MLQLGDSQAACVGVGCTESTPTRIKLSLGTGAFANVVSKRPRGTFGVLHSFVGWHLAERPPLFVVEARHDDAATAINWALSIGLLGSLEELSTLNVDAEAREDSMESTRNCVFRMSSVLCPILTAISYCMKTCASVAPLLAFNLQLQKLRCASHHLNFACHIGIAGCEQCSSQSSSQRVGSWMPCALSCKFSKQLQFGLFIWCKPPF